MNIHKDSILNNLYTTSSQKLPLYNNIIVDYGDEPGMFGEIAFQNSTGTFYGHNGITWTPFSGGSSTPSIWTLDNNNNFIQDITQPNVGFGQNNLIFGSETIDNGGDDTRMFFIAKSSGAQGSFRAGTCTTTDWNFTNLGANSVGFGFNTFNNGSNSMVAGNQNRVNISSECAIFSGGSFGPQAGNQIVNSSRCVITGGTANTIGTPLIAPSNCGIIAGSENTLGSTSAINNSVIVAGNNNILNSNNSSILAGANLSSNKDNTTHTKRFQTTERVQHGITMVSSPDTTVLLTSVQHYVCVVDNSDNVTFTLPAVTTDVVGQELYIVTRSLNTIVNGNGTDVITDGSGASSNIGMDITPGQIYAIQLIANLNITPGVNGWLLVSKSIS
jgi:hypothetical protein